MDVFNGFLFFSFPATQNERQVFKVMPILLYRLLSIFHPKGSAMIYSVHSSCLSGMSFDTHTRERWHDSAILCTKKREKIKGISMMFQLLRVVIRIPPKKEGKREICVCLCVMCVTKSSEMMSRERTSISAQPAEAQHASFYIYMRSMFPYIFSGLVRCVSRILFIFHQESRACAHHVPFWYQEIHKSNETKWNEIKSKLTKSMSCDKWRPRRTVTTSLLLLTGRINRL